MNATQWWQLVAAFLGVALIIMTIVLLLMMEARREQQARVELWRTVSEDSDALRKQAVREAKMWRQEFETLEKKLEAEALNEESMQYLHESLRRAADGDPTT